VKSGLELAPQLPHYEGLIQQGTNWVPYVMFRNNPNYRSPAVNTDSRGFRISYAGSQQCSLADHRPDGPVSLVLGGSTAFGFGAGSDEATLASQLARCTGRPWLNLASNGCNSTQEVMLFLLHRHELPAVQDIVIFSGINNLVTSGMPDPDNDYGKFFYSGDFYSKMNSYGENGVDTSKASVSSLPQADSVVSRLRQLIRRKPAAAAPPEPAPVAERVASTTDILARDLDRLLDLAAPTGARVHFALQPTISWTGKPWSAEERSLCDDPVSPMWATVWHDFLGDLATTEVHGMYARRVADLCEQRGISFIDVSQLLGKSEVADHWLFLDTCHLSDEGLSVVAEMMQNEFNLQGVR